MTKIDAEIDTCDFCVPNPPKIAPWGLLECSFGLLGAPLGAQGGVTGLTFSLQKGLLVPERMDVAPHRTKRDFSMGSLGRPGTTRGHPGLFLEPPGVISERFLWILRRFSGHFGKILVDFSVPFFSTRQGQTRQDKTRQDQARPDQTRPEILVSM